MCRRAAHQFVGILGLQSKITTLLSLLLLLGSIALFFGYSVLAWLANFADGVSLEQGDPSFIWMILLTVSFFKYVLLVYAISFFILTVGAMGLILRKIWGRKLVIFIFQLFCFLSALTFFVKLFVTFYVVDSGNAILAANSFTPSLSSILYNAMTTALWCGGLLLPVLYLRRTSVMKEFGIDYQASNLGDLNVNDI